MNLIYRFTGVLLLVSCSITAAAQDAPAPVRAANQPLFDRATKLLDLVERTSERLRDIASKPSELRGKTEQLRREIVDQYRAIQEARELGDELILRGERDGLTVRGRAESVQGPLDAAVAQVRPGLGSSQGLSNAMIRRARDQLAPLKQLEDIITRAQDQVDSLAQLRELRDNPKWTHAYRRYAGLLEDADQVGRFVDAAEAKQLYEPIEERGLKIRPGYLLEQKATLEESLAEEFASERSAFTPFLADLAAARQSVRDAKLLRWRGESVRGPALTDQLAETWRAIHPAALNATAILHARGTPANNDLKVFLADYEAARAHSFALVSDAVAIETNQATDQSADATYVGFLRAIPKLMSTMNAAPADFERASAVLEQLADKSPVLAKRVRDYRTATDETIKWRRRMVAAYLKAASARPAAATPLEKLVDSPPALPGQEGPGGLKRTNQAYWSLEQTPADIAKLWTDQWQGSAIAVATVRANWPVGADPKFTSAWQRRICLTAVLPRQQVVALSTDLARDLFVAKDSVPLTLEAAFAIETSLHGPFIRLEGAVTSASVESIPDRITEAPDSLDLAGALSLDALSNFPRMPARVELAVTPTTLAHELIYWTAAPAPTPTMPPPAPSAPVAAQSMDGTTGKSSEAGDAKRPDESGKTPAAAAGSAPQPADATASTAGEVPKKLEPAKSPPRVPKGGVPF